MRWIDSPVEKWPGQVALFSPLTFPQTIAFEQSLRDAAEQGDNYSAANYAMLPGIIACVAEWKLENFPQLPTPDNWPASPRRSSARLIAWLVTEISGQYDEETPDPNA